MNWLGSMLAQMVAAMIMANRVSKEIVEHADDWFKFSLSLTGTAFVTFLGVWGASGLALLGIQNAVPLSGLPAQAGIGIPPWPVAVAMCVIALTGGFLAGCLACAAAVLALWKRSPLTRGIPILAPMKVEEKVLQGGFVLTEPAKGEK